MGPVSFILFVLFGLLGILMLYKASKYVSRTVEEEQENTQSSLQDNDPRTFV